MYPEAALTLIDRCRQGDQRAWSELYDEHFDFARHTARRLGAPEADLDDAVQDAFQVVWRQLRHFTHGRFTTWLFRIVANVVSERLRKKRVRDSFASYVGLTFEVATGPTHGRVEARQLLSRLSPVLESLGHEKERVFSLYEFEGCTHAEIAKRTNTKEQTVRTRLHYARRDLERMALRLDLLP